MSFLYNFENSIPDEEMPSQKVLNAFKEMLEDPEHHKLMERLKYMEENGI